MDLGIPADGQKAVLDAAGFQKQKKLECLTAEDVNNIKNLSAHPDLKELNCQLKSDPKWAGNKVTFTMTCAEDDLRMTMITDMTFATDAFTSVTKVTDDKGRITTMGGKISARRVGECTK
jgi:hypothetical protein